MTKSKKLTSLAALEIIATLPVVEQIAEPDTGAEIEQTYTHEEPAIMTDDEAIAILKDQEVREVAEGLYEAPPATEEVLQATNLPAVEEPTKDDAPADFDELIAALSKPMVEEKAEQILDAFDDRIANEEFKDPDNLSIVKNLKKYRSKLGLLSSAAVMLACAVDEGFINRSLNAGSAYNVYAIDKVADIVQALNGAPLNNAINNAVMRSMFKFRAAGEVFTGEMAKAAASCNIRGVTPSLNKHLVRYTVSPSTAPTQASSTMSALQTLGIVVNKGSQKLPVYELTDTPATRQLEKVLLAA